MRRSIEKQQGSEREREREKEVKVVETQGARGEGGRQRERAPLLFHLIDRAGASASAQRVKSAAVRAGQVRCSPTHAERKRTAATTTHLHTQRAGQVRWSRTHAERSKPAATRRWCFFSRLSGVLGVGISRNTIRKQLCVFF